MLLSLCRAARRCGVSPRRVRALAKAGALPTYRDRFDKRVVLVDPEDVQRLKAPVRRENAEHS